jgi:hypothetical protein
VRHTGCYDGKDTVQKKNELTTKVADPDSDPHYFEELDPDPDPHQSEKLDLIRLKVKFVRNGGSKWNHGGP